jgi:ArsR family transcriptional regulator, arsenate/arsenite/antimonite-responsive transcriptional repressor
MNLIYKALADPTRRKILELLRDRDLSTREIAAHFNLAKPTLSGYFAILKAADLIR